MSKEDIKYIVIYKNMGMINTQGNALFKTLEEVERFIVRGDIAIVYVGEYKPLKIKIEDSKNE